MWCPVVSWFRFTPWILVRYLRTMFTIVKLELICGPQLNAIENAGLQAKRIHQWNSQPMAHPLQIGGSQWTMDRHGSIFSIRRVSETVLHWPHRTYLTLILWWSAGGVFTTAIHLQFRGFIQSTHPFLIKYGWFNGWFMAGTKNHSTWNFIESLHLLGSFPVWSGAPKDRKDGFK